MLRMFVILFGFILFFSVTTVSAQDDLVTIVELNTMPIAFQVGDEVLVFYSSDFEIPNIGGGSIVPVFTSLFDEKEFTESNIEASVYSFAESELVSINDGKIVTLDQVQYYASSQGRLVKGNLPVAIATIPQSTVTLYVSGDRAQIVELAPESIAFCQEYDELSLALQTDASLEIFVIELTWVGQSTNAITWLDIEGNSVLLVQEPVFGCGLLVYNFQIGEALLQLNLMASSRWNYSYPETAVYYWQDLLQDLKLTTNN